LKGLRAHPDLVYRPCGTRLSDFAPLAEELLPVWHARLSIGAEHTIGRMKNFRILADIHRGNGMTNMIAKNVGSLANMNLKIARRTGKGKPVAVGTGRHCETGRVFRVSCHVVSLNSRQAPVNARRVVLYEPDHIAPQGIRQLERIEVIIKEPNSDPPTLVREGSRS